MSRLEIRLDGICHACLSFVSFPLQDGDLREVERQVKLMTPILWDDGVSQQALPAARRAVELGIADAHEGLLDLERRGARSVVARSIVKRLAAELSRRTRIEMVLEARARERLALAPPELN